MPTPGKRVGRRDAMLNITVTGYRPSPSQQPGTAWPLQAARTTDLGAS
jgi:NADH-quinone oxidoreductase subunit A